MEKAPGTSGAAQPIDLRTPLSLRTSFAFPLQSAAARREVLIGGALLLLPGVGWLLNMGHRIAFVHNMLHGRPAWPAWRGYGALLRHGALTFGGMAFYYSPAAALGWAAARWHSPALAGAAVVLALLATVAIPGYMTHYCWRFDPAEIYDPFRALSRALEGGADYWRAWGIALAALAVSLVGLLGLGVGFLATSVWFWQAAGFSFATVFARKFLDAEESGSTDPARPRGA
ncbi:MAG: hypothetical protein JWM27_1102 [Gemmatimonadetes bacterium]|nr:hypothetical protein [Gemmatimonadota bacterium]